MYLFIGCFILFIMVALSVLAFPFVRYNQSLISKPYIVISHFIIITSIILYFCFGQSKELFDWFSYGKNHYDLSIKVEELGGIDGMIAHIKKKLETTPNDKKGLALLNKLTIIKKNTP